MKIINQSEFSGLIDSLTKKEYVDLSEVKFVHSLFLQVCDKFEIEGICVFIQMSVDLEKEPRKKIVPDGFRVRGRFCQTGTRKEVIGESIGSIRFGFMIGCEFYCLHECFVGFGNGGPSQIPRRLVFSYLHDKLNPEITQTLKTLSFLKDKGFIAFNQ